MCKCYVNNKWYNFEYITCDGTMPHMLWCNECNKFPELNDYEYKAVDGYIKSSKIIINNFDDLLGDWGNVYISRTEQFEYRLYMDLNPGFDNLGEHPNIDYINKEYYLNFKKNDGKLKIKKILGIT